MLTANRDITILLFMNATRYAVQVTRTQEWVNERPEVRHLVSTPKYYLHRTAASAQRKAEAIKRQDPTVVSVEVVSK